MKFLLKLGRDRERDRFWPFAAEPQSHGRVQPALQRPPFSLAQSSEQFVASAGRTVGAVRVTESVDAVNREQLALLLARALFTP